MSISQLLNEMVFLQSHKDVVAVLWSGERRNIITVAHEGNRLRLPMLERRDVYKLAGRKFHHPMVKSFEQNVVSVDDQIPANDFTARFHRNS